MKSFKTFLFLLICVGVASSAHGMNKKEKSVPGSVFSTVIRCVSGAAAATGAYFLANRCYGSWRGAALLAAAGLAYIELEYKSETWFGLGRKMNHASLNYLTAFFAFLPFTVGLGTFAVRDLLQPQLSWKSRKSMTVPLAGCFAFMQGALAHYGIKTYLQKRELD